MPWTGVTVVVGVVLVMTGTVARRRSGMTRKSLSLLVMEAVAEAARAAEMTRLSFMLTLCIRMKEYGRRKLGGLRGV